MSTHSQCRVNHSSDCSVMENLDRRIDSRVEWSTESKAELRSSKASERSDVTFINSAYDVVVYDQHC